MSSATSVKGRLKSMLHPGRGVPSEAPGPCLHCGYGRAVFLGTKVHPDFDTGAVLSEDLRRAFSDRMDGICVRCGLYQSYRRFSVEQMRAMNSMGKDITTTEKAFHDYPPPADFTARLDDQYFGLRTRKWKAHLAAAGVRPAKAFFIRPFFGGSARFIQSEYGAETAGIDMSETCLRTTAESVPGFKPYRGAINGMLEGDFLGSGPYDAVFVFHTLTHACDPHGMLAQIASLVKPGGFAVFTHEVGRKPTNPFHMIHPSEMQLVPMLLRHFARVDRIDACEEPVPPFMSEFTAKGDNPDFLAWR